MRKSHILIVVVLTTVGIAALALFPQLYKELNGSAGSAKAAAPPQQPVPVIAATATRELFIESLEALGTAVARESVEITPTVEDRVVGIYFDDGDGVRQGQLLVKLDDSEAQYLLAEAKAALQEQEKQFDRTRKLTKTNAASRSLLDEELGKLEVAKARVATLEARLKDYTIRAPFSGNLGIRQISVGAVVDSDTVITTLDDTTTIKLDFTVPEIYLGALGLGMDVSARSAAYPDFKFDGKVTAIGSRIDPETRSLTIRAQIPNTDGLIKPGMLLSVDLIKERSQTLIIPEEAVIQEKNRKYALLVTDEKNVQKKEIETGRRRPGTVEVLSGLTEGQRVIVQGITRVRPGTVVNVVEVRNTGRTSG